MFENTTAAGAESGAENWAFYPRYTLRIQKRLKDNAAGSPASTSQPVHPYGVDGAPAVYTYDANGDGNLVASAGDKVYLYFGMRRGGRGYYALDISNPNTPKMLWSISNATSGFSELGLTFSRPILTKMSYLDGTTPRYNEPVLVFGAGYDINKDVRSNSSGTNDSMGRGVFIVNAKTGALVWKAVYGSTTMSVSATEYNHVWLTDSIPAEVAILDSDGDGATDRLYAATTAGDVFRFNMPGMDRTQWKAWLFSETGRFISGATKNDDRRYFHSVDVVQTIDIYGGYYDAVIVGSGDRANPLDKGMATNKIPENWAFMFKDRNYQKANPATTPTKISFSDLADLSDNCMQYSTATEGCSDATKTALKDYGWRIKLDQTTGEKMLSKPITLGGVVFFTTYLPPDSTLTSTCGPVEGGGSTYAVNLQDATPAFDWDLTNTFTDSAGDVQTMAASDRYREAGAGIPADVIAIRKGGLLQAVTPGDNYTTTVSQNAGWKTFWYTEGD
jgi:type IV pilus assembly protein PilY1